MPTAPQFTPVPLFTPLPLFTPAPELVGRKPASPGFDHERAPTPPRRVDPFDSVLFARVVLAISIAGLICWCLVARVILAAWGLIRLFAS